MVIFWFIRFLFLEQFVLGVLWELAGCWDQDYDRVVLLLLDVQQFCYLFYRLDSQNVQGFEWFFFVWLFDNFFVSFRDFCLILRSGVGGWKLGLRQVIWFCFGEFEGRDIRFCLREFERGIRFCVWSLGFFSFFGFISLVLGGRGCVG